MSADLRAVLEANREVLSRLDKREWQIAEREGEAQRQLEQCATERREVESERHGILQAEKLYRRYLGDEIDGEPLPLEFPTIPADDNESPNQAVKRRARVGEQRYRILVLLRTEAVALPETTIPFRTGLAAKRVRDQIRSDASDGIIKETIPGHYRITESGLELLARFEAYKTKKGQPLPSLQGPLGDDAEDGIESDEPETEERAA